MQFWIIEIYHLMLNETPNVMTELAPKGPRFVKITEIMDPPDIPKPSFHLFVTEKAIVFRCSSVIYPHLMFSLLPFQLFVQEVNREG